MANGVAYVQLRYTPVLTLYKHMEGNAITTIHFLQYSSGAMLQSQFAAIPSS
jgi:hypothetical protein